MNRFQQGPTPRYCHEGAKGSWFDSLTTSGAWDSYTSFARPELVEGRACRALRIFIMVVSVWAVSVPAFAELDLSGMWANRLHEDSLSRGPGPRIGDYMGLPINDEARARADAWQISIQTMPERQCIL